MTLNSILFLLVLALSFGFSPVFVLLNRLGKLQKAAAGFYLSSSCVICGFLLYGMSAGSFPFSLTRWSVDHLRFPLILALFLCAPAGVCLAVFRDAQSEVERRSTVGIPLAAGLAILSLASTKFSSHLVFLFSSTLVSGWVLTGFAKIRLRIMGRAFFWWVISDVLIALGAIMGFLLLGESAVLYQPPLLSGNDVQIGIVLLLFLSGGLIRLGVFPFSSWVGKIFTLSEPAWSAFFLGCLNLCLAGFRVVIACVMVARLVALDLTAVMASIGLISIIAGVVMMLKAPDYSRYVSGICSLFAGTIFAGFSFFSRGSVNGSLFMLFTAPSLFFCTFASLGRIQQVSGFDKIGRNRIGISDMPGCFLSLVFCALSLAGIPPTDGFISKFLIINSFLSRSPDNVLWFITSIIILISAAFTLLAFARFLGLNFSTGSRLSQRAISRGGSLFANSVSLLIASSLPFFGTFPRLIYDRVVFHASRALFPPGKGLPAVVFHPIPSVFERALKERLGASFDIAAVFVAFSLCGIIWYFLAQRASRRGEV